MHNIRIEKIYIYWTEDTIESQYVDNEGLFTSSESGRFHRKMTRSDDSLNNITYTETIMHGFTYYGDVACYLPGHDVYRYCTTVERKMRERRKFEVKHESLCCNDMNHVSFLNESHVLLRNAQPFLSSSKSLILPN